MIQSVLPEKIKFELKRHKGRYTTMIASVLYCVVSGMIMNVMGMTQQQTDVVQWLVAIPVGFIVAFTLISLEKRYKINGEIHQ